MLCDGHNGTKGKTTIACRAWLPPAYARATLAKFPIPFRHEDGPWLRLCGYPMIFVLSHPASQRLAGKRVTDFFHKSSPSFHHLTASPPKSPSRATLP